jgi:hypothetical protein
VLVGAEAAGIWESTDGGEKWSKVTTLEGQPGREEWDDPANQPPGHLGISALMTDPDDAERFWAIVQGVGFFETADDGKTWTPRNRGLRADWPRPHEEIGFCVHRLVRSPADPTGSTSRTTSHAPERRPRPLVDGDHRGPAVGVRLAAAAPARRRQLLRDPARPPPLADDARRAGSRVAYERRRLDVAEAHERPAAAEHAHWAPVTRHR